MAAAMLPKTSPQRVRHAHDRIVPFLDFLAQYKGWVANAGANYCDFALGNPQAMPLPGVVSAIREAATPLSPDWYAYKMSESASREIVRDELVRMTEQPYASEDIFLTNGATGALMVILNALIGEDDEVIYSTPPWHFYEGMIVNSGGRPVPVPVKPDFDLDLDAIDTAITTRTRLIIVNSPNNPTGKIYAQRTLEKLSALLESSSQRIGRSVYLISDEAYRTIVYDDRDFVSPTTCYRNAIMVYTYGKTLLTPGQRIGYLALSPGIDDRDEMRALMLSSQILCGWAMSSALMQHGLARLAKLSVNVDELQVRRDRFVNGLRDCGYEVHKPAGGFYITPKTPITNDELFVEALAKEGVFCLPGRIVHMPGHLRASVTGSDEMIERALPLFSEVLRRFR